MLIKYKYGEIIDIRFPSLKYNTHRRFCYVQFKSSDQAKAATEQNGKVVDGKLKLVAKISAPENKQNRMGPLYDGRELYVSNVDWHATEEDLSQKFSKYGKVERIRIPRNVVGKSKGVAFVVFSTKVSIVSIKSQSARLLTDGVGGSKCCPSTTSHRVQGS